MIKLYLKSGTADLIPTPASLCPAFQWPSLAFWRHPNSSLALTTPQLIFRQILSLSAFEIYPESRHFPPTLLLFWSKPLSLAWFIIRYFSLSLFLLCPHRSHSDLSITQVKIIIIVIVNIYQVLDNIYVFNSLNSLTRWDLLFSMFWRKCRQKTVKQCAPRPHS